VLVGSLLFAVIVVASAGTLILAISSLSRNSRYVGALWLGIWIISETSAGVLFLTIHREWCPLLSYTANLGRVREALLDTPTSRQKLSGLFQAGQDQIRRAPRPGPFGRRRGSASVSDRPATPPSGPPSAPPPGRSASSSVIQDAGGSATYPWQWSAGVLAGLGALSILTLSSRIRSLDRLR
jgi:ABC-2 type transport system permease protein